VRAGPRQRPLKQDRLPPQSPGRGNRHHDLLALQLARERGTSEVTSGRLVPSPQLSLPADVRQEWVSYHTVTEPVASVVSESGISTSLVMMSRVGARPPGSVLPRPRGRLGDLERRVGMPVEAPTIGMPVEAPTTQTCRDQARVGLYRMHLGLATQPAVAAVGLIRRISTVDPPMIRCAASANRLDGRFGTGLAQVPSPLHGVRVLLLQCQVREGGVALY